MVCREAAFEKCVRAGYPVAGGGEFQMYADPNKAPIAQVITTEARRPFICQGLYATAPMVCLALPIQSALRSGVDGT